MTKETKPFIKKALTELFEALNKHDLLSKSGKDALEKGLPDNFRFDSSHLKGDEITTKFDENFDEWLESVKEAEEFVFFDFGIKDDNKGDKDKESFESFLDSFFCFIFFLFFFH